MSATVHVIGKPGRESPESIPPETVAEFEAGYTVCKDQKKLLVVRGTSDERIDYIRNAKLWARNRSERLTVRLYPHPDPEPESTYYRIINFVRGSE